MSLGRDTIASLGGKNFTVKRSTGGSYVNGIWVESGASITSVFACEQPLTGHDIERIPEGERTKERRKLYSADELRVHSEATGAEADVVTIDGIDFQVESVQKWTDYWKAIIVKVEHPEAS